MHPLLQTQQLLLTALGSLADALRRRWHQQLCQPQRGDVPGWVLITMMTAGLVTALWVFAGDELVSIFNQAIHGVHGPDQKK